jgi:hypothetical protein
MMHGRTLNMRHIPGGNGPLVDRIQRALVGHVDTLMEEADDNSEVSE